MTYTSKENIHLYEQMVRIRAFEEEVYRNVQSGWIHGTTHLCIGQEAVAVGVCTLLQKGDKITSTHRGHGHSIAMGARLDKMMAELFGKSTGYCKGKGGSMHIADVASGNLGANGIVGGGIPIAVGSALTTQLQGKEEVTVCFFGDGATNEGSFHESLNIASIWDLPVIFVCENNVYGMSSAITEMVNIDRLADRAYSYGIPGVMVDGNDVYQVMKATNEAIQRAREGKGPTLIEAKTYRFSGHSKSDKEAYRTQEEVETMRQYDPIVRLENQLLEDGCITKSRLEQIKKQVQKQVEDATTFAKESPEPEMGELFTDVYA